MENAQFFSCVLGQLLMAILSDAMHLEQYHNRRRGLIDIVVV